MRLELRLHPDSVCDAVTHLEASVTRPSPKVLSLNYLATGAVADLYLPPATSPTRADELWRRTCFEAFIRPEPGEAYFEFNFAPSRQWAAYRFSGYRTGMSPVDEIAAPSIDLRTTAQRLELSVLLDLGRLADLPAGLAWRLGLSAVIEETNGRKSYWALTHPPGKADFHHADGFACEIRGQER